MSKENNKKLFWAALSAGALLLAAGLFGGVRVWKNTGAARAAAEEFTERLSAGELTFVRMKCYQSGYGAAKAEGFDRWLEDEGADEAAGAGEEQTVLYDSEGNPAVRYITEQELMDLYGEELVMAGQEETAEAQDRCFAVIMDHSVISYQVGLAMGKTARMTVTLTGPDLAAWADGLETGEAEEMLYTEDLPGWLEKHLSSGEVPERTLTFAVPMEKVNGRWRFQVTEEMERAFFGGV